MARRMEGGGERLFEGGDYFKYFHQRGMGGGNYSREVINRGTATIRGNTVRPCINNSSPDFASVRASGHLGAAVVSDVTGRRELFSSKKH